jgi:hypothetical protein
MTLVECFIFIFNVLRLPPWVAFNLSKGYEGVGWVTSVTQQVHIEYKVFDALTTALDPRVIRQCKFLKNISLGGCFYSENYARQPTQGTSALRAPFLPQLLPGTRGNMSHPFTLCRSVSFQKRSKPCCTTESWAHPHFLAVGPSHWSKPFTAFSAQCMPTQFTQAGLAPNIHPQRWST